MRSHRTSRGLTPRDLDVLADVLSATADRLHESFRTDHAAVDWRVIRAVRNFVAHDDRGTDANLLRLGRGD